MLWIILQLILLWCVFISTAIAFAPERVLNIGAKIRRPRMTALGRLQPIAKGRNRPDRCRHLVWNGPSATTDEMGMYTSKLKQSNIAPAGLLF
jgi:hypothetical protein